MPYILVNPNVTPDIDAVRDALAEGLTNGALVWGEADHEEGDAGRLLEAIGRLDLLAMEEENNV